MVVLLTEADQLWDLGKLHAARRLFERGAAAGDPTSQLNYGYFLEQGLGGRKNVAEAMRCYRAAYRRGVTAAAANNIAILFREANRPRLAEKWFQRAIAGGDIGAALELGKLYRDFLKDIPQARKSFQMVARSRRSIPSEREEALALVGSLSR